MDRENIGFFKRIQRKIDTHVVNILRPEFLRGAAGSFALKIVYTGLMFGTSLFLTSFLGAGGFGTYVYAIAWINVLVIASTLGLDKLLIREVAILSESQNWPLFRGVLQWSNRAGLLTSVSIVIGLLIVTLLVDLEPPTVIALQIASILLPILTLTRLRQGVMHGLYRIIPGQLPEMLVQPIIFLGLISLAYVMFASVFDAYFAIIFHIIAATVAFFLGTALLNKYLPREVKQTPPVYERRIWLGSTLPFLLVSGMRVIDSRIDIIMLGLLGNAVQVGIYDIVVKGTELITFVYVAVNIVMAPTIARLNGKGNLAEFQKFITLATRLVFICALPVGLAFIFAGNYYLMIFGSEFLDGRLALSIISVSKVFSVAVGSVGFILTMSGYEKDATWAVGGGALINFILNLILIPIWGINGAAAATATGTVIVSTVLGINVYRRLGIQPTILGPLFKSKTSDVQVVGD